MAEDRDGDDVADLVTVGPELTAFPGPQAPSILEWDPDGDDTPIFVAGARSLLVDDGRLRKP